MIQDRETMRAFVAGVAFATFVLLLGRAMDMEMTRVVMFEAACRPMDLQYAPSSSDSNKGSEDGSDLT